MSKISRRQALTGAAAAGIAAALPAAAAQTADPTTDAELIAMCERLYELERSGIDDARRASVPVARRAQATGRFPSAPPVHADTQEAEAWRDAVFRQFDYEGHYAHWQDLRAEGIRLNDRILSASARTLPGLRAKMRIADLRLNDYIEALQWHRGIGADIERMIAGAPS